MASTKGSMIEFGVAPILISGFIFQLLAGLRLINVNFEIRKDRELFQSAQKITAFIITFALSIGLVFSGYYGPINSLSLANIFLLVIQLFWAGSLIIFLTEVLDKGHGMGSGILLFVGINSGAKFVNDLFSFVRVSTPRGSVFTGAIPAFISSIRSKNFKNAIIESFTRSSLPNLNHTYVSILTFFGSVYFQNFRIEIPLRSNKVRSAATNYPIRLLYTGGLPILFLFSILFLLNSISYLLYSFFPLNTAVRLFGTWISSSTGTEYVLNSGLLYYITPPSDIKVALFHPLKTIGYIVFAFAFTTPFAKIWSDITGSSAKGIAQTFKEQGLVIAGHREGSVTKELKRVIPTAAVAGASVLTAIAVASDILGGDGRGPALVAGVCAVFHFMEVFATDAQSGNSMIAQYFNAGASGQGF